MTVLELHKGVGVLLVTERESSRKTDRGRGTAAELM